MSSSLAGYGETVVCPYNKSHVIRKERIQFHLVKCARSHPNITLEVCPFNKTHQFRTKEELNAHCEECSDRESFDRYMTIVQTIDHQPVKNVPKPAPPPCDDGEEMWDHYNAPTYDPQKYAQNAHVLRAPKLLQPAERRKFADSERKRLSAIRNCPNPN